MHLTNCDDLVRDRKAPKGKECVAVLTIIDCGDLVPTEYKQHFTGSGYVLNK